jgi:hypothetical protein
MSGRSARRRPRPRAAGGSAFTVLFLFLIAAATEIAHRTSPPSCRTAAVDRAAVPERTAGQVDWDRAAVAVIAASSSSPSAPAPRPRRLAVETHGLPWPRAPDA